MSFGLGLVKGLVGGFTRTYNKNKKFVTDDQKKTGKALEDTLFKQAMILKKTLPQELGNMLKEAKTTLEGRQA